MKKKKYDVWLFSLKKRENSFNNLTNGPIICQLLVSMRKYFRTSSGRNIKFSHVQNSLIISHVSLPCQGC